MIDIGSFDLRKWKSLLRRKRERLGVEIEGRSVRIVRLARIPAGGYSVAAHGSLDIDLWHASAMEQQRFRAAIQQLGKGLQRAAVNIDHSTLRIRRMIFARMPERDLLEAIRWNFREHVEVPIDKYVVSYVPLEQIDESGRMAVMAYGISEEAVGECVQLVRSVGLKLVALEPSATALLAAFSANGVLTDGGNHVCIDFGESITRFLVMKNDAVLFSRPLGGINQESLVEILMRNHNMDKDKAQDALSSWIREGMAGDRAAAAAEEGGDAASGAKGIETSVGHFFSQMVIELQRSIDAFCIMYSADRVDVIHVCGIAPLYPGLISHIQTSLGVQTLMFNPFLRFMDESRQTEDMRHKAPLYAVAVGLAIP